MAENEPAEAGWVNCGWTEVHGEGYYGGYYVTSLSYSDYCNDVDIEEACTAQAGGPISLLLLLSAMIFCICAVVWVNPFCNVQMKCGDCYRRLFIVTLVLVIIGIIAWFALGSSFCMSYLDLGVGTSMVLSIISAILVAIAIGILYSP